MNPGLIHHRVSSAATARPNGVAIAGKDELTYESLDRQSTQLANLLRSNGCESGDRVAFLLPKKPRAIMVMVAILKAGCAYVPLDPAGPAARLQQVIDLCEPRQVIGDGSGANLLIELKEADPQLTVGWLEQEGPPPDLASAVLYDSQDLARAPDKPIPIELAATAPAYILFTSGSTGTPKGVIISHANVGAFLDWAIPHFGMGPHDRVSSHSPLHFDLSVFDVFGALSAGASLHLVDPLLNLVPQQLIQFIRDRELTQWFSVPSLLTYMASHDVVKPDDLPALRRLLWCGEVMPNATLQYWMERLPHVRFTNLYGPTETTIASSFFDVPGPPREPRADIPIGTACAGEELLVLDSDLMKVEPGHQGELCIMGDGLSPGYFRDEERTAAVFVDTAHSGRVYRTGDIGWIDEEGLAHFSGRQDTQIKTRGYRVELGEVHNAVTTVDAVRECAIVAIETERFEGKIICCAFVPSSNQETAATVRRQLSAILPRYMVPRRWLEYELLPRNAAGKVDQVAIRREFEHGHAQSG